MNEQDFKVTLKYAAFCLLAVFVTFLLHEGAHYFMGKALGYEMYMTMNSAGLAEGQVYQEEWQKQLVSIAGPIFTIIQAVILFSILKKINLRILYPYIFTVAVMRTMASIVSYLTMANDEARVSEWLNIGKMTLPIIVSTFLIFLVFKATLLYKIPWKFNLATFLITSFGIGGVVLINELVFK